MRGYGVQLHSGPDFASEQVQKDDNSFIVGRIFKPADVIGEGARHDLHGGAFLDTHPADLHQESALSLRHLGLKELTLKSYVLRLK